MNAAERTFDLPLTLTRGGDLTLTEQLSRQLADRIRARWLPAGTRLPSVREASRRYGISAHTVVAAYDHLLAQGLVEARQQRGFFVREQRATVPVDTAPSTKAASPCVPVDAATLIRSMFQSPNQLPAPGLGTLPESWLDLPILSSALRRVISGDRLGPLALRYGEPAGDLRFRKAVSHRLSELGIKAEAGQIITTVGATQALDVVTRTLMQPGDAVMVDEPGWAVEFARLGRLGLRILPVPRGSHGPDLSIMKHWIATQSPKLYITVSVLHNPTSSSLSMADAHQVLKLAEAHNFMVLEDDTYSYLAPNHAPRLSALDGLQRTIYVSGFSKILTPAWRVGYIAAPSAWVDRLTDTKMLGTLSTPALLEQAVADCLEQGTLRRHAQRLNEKVDAARARTVKLAQDAGVKFVHEPQGLFGWVDVGCDTDQLALQMMEQGWLLAPGSLFHAQKKPSTLMRINYASCQDAKFWRALKAST